MRSFALLDLGFSSISSLPGKIGFLVMTLPLDSLPHTQTGKSGGHYVFMIPVEAELDLKKAAKAVGEKAVEMLKSKELLGLTGYIHGGCSPVGMKKKFKTVIDESAEGREFFYVSAGKVGFQVKVSPEKLANFIGADFADLTV